MSLNIDLHATVEIIQFLEVSKSQSEVILDSLPGLFLIIDANGIIIRGNRHLAEYLFVDFENLIGQRFDQFVDSKWSEFSEKMAKMKTLKLEAIEFDMAIENQITERANFHWNVRPLDFPGRDGTDLNIYLIVGRRLRSNETEKSF